ncbi:MAG: apolipoprotein N-acyltransferase [Gammaproteobacteria bacterium]|nr:apolipoprotein N-acyltransferase [Gammaproteobacteria bacterium]
MTQIPDRKSYYLALFACFLSGALLVAAFAPLEWSPLAFLCTAVLFYCCRDRPARQTFWIGLSFGYGLFLVGVSWVYVSLHTYGGMPLWMGSIAVLLFAGILGVFSGFTTYSAARLFPGGGATRILALGFLWIIFEWLKSWVFTGFPWLELGYTQTATWLFGFAPLGGVYLVSLVVVVVASCLVLLWKSPGKLVPSLAITMIFILGWYAGGIQWSKDIGDAIKVGIVQPNVPINQKWQAQYRDRVVNRLQTMSRELGSQSSPGHGQIDLLVWPETALPIYYQQTDQAFWQALVPSGTALLTGVVDNPEPAESYNAAVLSCAGVQHLYRKRHLVPFGEYLPMRFLFNWLLEYLRLPMSDFSSWSEPQVLNCGDNINIGLSICYEDAFASEMRRHVGDASLLINISEDAWFGDSLAPHQRLQMAQMRARELSRPLVRSANTGPSVVIDQFGTVLVRTTQFQARTLSHRIWPQTGETPYKRWGNWIIWLAMLVVVTMFAVKRRSRNE